MQKSLHARDLPPAAVEAGRDDEIDLLQLVRVLWRGKIWIALIAGAVLAIGWYRNVHTATPLFTATTEMALIVDAAPVVDLQAVVMGFSGDEPSINTKMALITSGEMIGRLVDELRLDQDPEFNGYLVDPNRQPGLMSRARAAVREGLKSVLRAVMPGAFADDAAEPPPPPPTPEEQRQATIDSVRGVFTTASSWDTYVFSISATTTDPGKSVLLANALGDIFREDSIRSKVELTERTAEWLSERVGELRAELDERQTAISDLRARSALVSEESLQALNQQAIDLRSQLSETQAQLSDIEDRLTRLEAAQAGGSIEDKRAAAADSQLDAAASAVAQGEEGAEARFDRRFVQILQQTRAERDRARERVAELQRAVDDLALQFESQSADFQQLQQLEQEAEATRVLYETFLTRLREISVQETVQQPDSRVLTPASSAVQIAPKPSRSLALSLMLGLVLGAGVVLGREFLQNTFRTAEDLERHTGRPVLGQIPLIPSRKRLDTIRYLQSKPTSAAAEAVRNLRTSILLSDVDRPPQVIMTTSSVPAEGKTTISIALSQNLAGLQKKVLLIEGDIRRRSFEAYFGRTRAKGGLLSVVMGDTPLAEAVIHPEEAGIDILLGERSQVNAADLFSSDSFRRFVEQVRASYDYVVIDTPPVLVVPDARVIAQHADAVVYVVHWDHTGRTQVEEGLRLFRSVNAPVSGLVLSQVDPRGMRRYGYGGRYGPYSRYAKSYYGS